VAAGRRRRGRGGRGGSRAGRVYSSSPCLKCGKAVARNVLPQHERRCKALTVERWERVLGPAQQWVARCYEIACAAVKHALVPKGSSAVYGHWLGPIAPWSHFAGKAGLGFCQHGWVLLPDGRICDPTRWVFEGAAPYIYVGRADHYDEGGNKLREAFWPSVAPRWDAGDDQVEITKDILPSDAWSFVEKLLNLWDSYEHGNEPGVVSRPQLLWLANRAPSTLGQHAYDIYCALARLDELEMVPLDNRIMVERLTGKKIA